MSAQAPMVIRLLVEQRKRCLATILNAAEASSWWTRLSDAQQTQFRDQVRAAIGVFYDFTRDVAKVTEDDVTRNEPALELIRSVHTQQQRISEKLDRPA